MVVYWLLLFVVIGGLIFGIYKGIMKIAFLAFPNSSPAPKTVAEKKLELKELRTRSNDLKQEVDATSK